MAEDEHYADVDIPDVIDETEHYTDTENPDTDTYEHPDAETFEIHNIEMDLDSEAIFSEEQVPGDKIIAQTTPKTDVPKSTRLPIARIKHIMKMDPDVNIVHQDAAFLVTKATELFLELMAKETYSVLQRNRKTINRKELDLVINRVDPLCFLEGAMDF